VSDAVVPEAGNRAGGWALTLGIVGLLALFAPAAVVVVIVGAAVSATAVVLGITGGLAFTAGRAATRHTAVTGIVLGLVGFLFWLLAIIGMVIGT